MEKTFLIINKDTRKLWRLQTAEHYTIKRQTETSFDVISCDEQLKAYVDVMGVLYFARNEQTYDKISFYKLRNFCNLLLKVHFDI